MDQNGLAHPLGDPRVRGAVGVLVFALVILLLVAFV
jgi:hypothetical protein